MDELRVPVTGGELAVLRWPGGAPDAPVVLAVHGITANALSFALVARALADSAAAAGADVPTLVAPDLRGRAGSSGLPPPYGMVAHAADLVAVLDHLDMPDAVLVGHSMGAYVATVTAVRHPERVRGLVLVDGGVSFPVPPGADLDALLTAVLGPAMARLAMTFPTRSAYADFWRRHPALAADWSAELAAYLDRDLVGQPPQLRSSCILDAVRTDGAQVLRDEETLAAVRRLPCSATLLWAPRGLQDEPQGLYDEQRLAAAALPASVAVRRLDDVNHYTAVVSARGAAQVAVQVAEQLRG